MTIEYNSVATELLKSVPEFETLYREHLAEYDERLPHVLFGDLTRFVIGLHERALLDPSAEEPLSRALSFLERLAVDGDSAAQELAVVSFLENLHQAGDQYEPLKRRLGPELTKALAKIE